MTGFSSAATRRFSSAALIAVATLMSLTSLGWAKAGFVQVKLSPAAFVSNCQSMGGTSSSGTGGGIKCVLPSGTVVECSFSAGDALCQYTSALPPKTQTKLLGDTPPDRLSPGTTPTTPKAPAASDTLN